MAGKASFPVDDGVYGTGGSRPIVDLINIRNHRLFVRDSDVDTPCAVPAQIADESAHLLRRNLESLVSRIDAAVVQGGLLEDG